MKKIKITLTDDHDLFREGLKFILSQYKGIDIIDEVANGTDLLKSLDIQLPDIVLMDIAMPKMNGVETTKKALDKYPDLKIIALSMFDDRNSYYQMIQAGAHGFIVKNTNGAELVKAIKEVNSGKNYFSTSLLKSIILNMSDDKNNKSEGNKNLFTKRESEILKLLCNGLTSSEIAEKLFISKKTVEGHKYNLFSKTGKKNTVNLVMYAVKNKLVEV